MIKLPPPVPHRLTGNISRALCLIAFIAGTTSGISGTPLLIGPQRLAELHSLFEEEEAAPVRQRFEEYLPSCQAPEDDIFATNATDAQRHYLWRLPAVALHHLLTGSAESLAETEAYLQALVDTPHWEQGQELDSGMGAANVMAGAALAYDWTKEHLNQELRSAFRETLALKMKALYEGGFQRGNPGTHYWQNDPQNNHRWHRMAGLTLAAATLHKEGALDPGYIQIVKDELGFIVEWLPEDGTTHESPSYMVFGLVYLVMAVQAADEEFGTAFREAPFFKTVGHYRKHTITPGFVDAFHYGDSGGFGSYNNAWYHIADINRDAELQAVMDRLSVEHPGAVWIEWMTLIWRDPALAEGRINPDDKVAYFDDLGLAIFRDGWSGDSVAAMFKSGLPGGLRLNEFRAENGFSNVNVAHDDPDANSFTLFINGEWVADTDRYSKRKRSANHNLILVNGAGQTAPGMPEASVWFQPSPDGVDMSGMATITKWGQIDFIAVIEGDATGSYDVESLERARRAFIWKEGSYILILDELLASDPSTFTWQIQSGAIEPLTGRDSAYVLKKGQVFCELQLASSAPLSPLMVESPADHRGELLGWQQLQMHSAPVSRLYIASLLLPWAGEANLQMEFTESDDFLLDITGLPGDDRWKWQPGPQGLQPGIFQLRTKENAAK